MKINTHYFYTTIRTPIDDENLFNDEISKMGIRQDSKIDKALYSAFDEKFFLQKSKKQEEMKEQKSFNSIICLNETEHKFEVYT